MIEYIFAGNYLYIWIDKVLVGGIKRAKLKDYMIFKVHADGDVSGSNDMKIWKRFNLNRSLIVYEMSDMSYNKRASSMSWLREII